MYPNAAGGPPAASGEGDHVVTAPTSAMPSGITPSKSSTPTISFLAVADMMDRTSDA